MSRPPSPARSGHQRNPAATQWLYGLHAVAAALANPRRANRRLVATPNAAARLAERGPLPLEPELLRPDAVGRLLPPGAVHQGAALECEPLEGLALDELPDDAFVVALDQVEDPHNVGAVLRSAAAFGADALLLTDRHGPEVTGVLAKAASGALEHVPLVVVTNLGSALQDLGKRAFQRVGLDSDGPDTFGSLRARRPLVLVLGAEGRGLRARTRSLCDAVARIEAPGPIRSLNVSNAAAIALHALAATLGPRGR